MSTTVARAAVRSFLRDFVTDGVPASGDNEPVKSEGRAALAAVCDAVDVAEAIATTGVLWTTNTVRVRSTGNVVIASALENGDTLNGVTLATGNHVFLGSQTAPAENGIYTVVASGAASRATWANTAAELARIGFVITEGTVGAGERYTLPLAASAITLETTSLAFALIGVEVDYAAQINASIDLLPSPFIATATDTEALAWISDVKIEGGVPGHRHYLNIEFVEFAGPIYRAKVYAYDEQLNIKVAGWDYQEAVKPTEATHPAVCLTMAGGGAIVSGQYIGTTGTAKVRWADVVWTKAVTAYTDGAATGLRPENVLSNEALDRDLLSGPSIAKEQIVATSGGDFTSARTAIEGLLYTATDRIGYFPNSDKCTPSNRVLTRVRSGLDEEITATPVAPNLPSGTGLMVPFGHALIVEEGARLWRAAGSSEHLIEGLWGQYYGGKGTLESLANGHVIHIDGENTFTRPAQLGPAVQRFRFRHLIEDLTLISGATSPTTGACIGMGISDNSVLVCRRVNFKRSGTTPSGLVYIHTSPSSVAAATIIFEDCTFNDGLITSDRAMNLLKSHSQTVRHRLIIRNTQMGEIVHEFGGTTGAAGFVRQGWMDSRITYTAALDPS